MVTNIILTGAIFFAIWSTSFIGVKVIYKNKLDWYVFAIPAIAYTIIITHYINIW